MAHYNIVLLTYLLKSQDQLSTHQITEQDHDKNGHFYCASYNTSKDRWRITSNGDDSNDDNDNDNEDDNDNNKNIDKRIVIIVKIVKIRRNLRD